MPANPRKKKTPKVADDWTDTVDWDSFYILTTGKDPKTGEYLAGNFPPDDEAESIAVENFFGIPAFNTR